MFQLPICWVKHTANPELHAVLTLRGYIDESHDGATVPKVFNLTCIIGYGNMLPWFEMAWINVLEKKNAELTKQNRPPISRYHAAYCSSLHGEFKGWTVSEQIDFSLQLFDVFRKHPLHIHSFDIPLQLLVKEIPETASNPIGFAYVILLVMLMDQINKKTLSLYPNDYISLHHDRCKYDGALADAFRDAVDDPNFTNREKFISINSESWQHSIMLQPADMISYENYKEGMREHFPEGRSRRKSLAALLDLDSISGRASGFNLETILELKATIDRFEPDTKKRLYDNARIKA
jgi:hypothetical protein